MKREIKFIIQNKETGHIYGSEKIDDSGDWQHTFEGKTKHCQFQKSEYGLLSSAIVKRQFTGLKDKNNKEIYEGDVVQTITSKTKKLIGGQVVWHGGGFCVNYDDEPNTFHWMIYEHKYEVVGNIYENSKI